MPLARAIRVRHHDDRLTADLAERAPALLTRDDAIGHKPHQRVSKHSGCNVEADAVFGPVGPILCVIPFKLQIIQANTYFFIIIQVPRSALPGSSL